jgi:2-methylisocitrate lyase-like PEP mutase family enzyme
VTKASSFAALHHGGRAFLLPNAWDVASALLLADAGFPAVGTTSLGVTAATGQPDGEGAGRDQTIALAGELAQRLPVPVTVDLEGGYADDPGTVAALAARLADLGVAGINLEDGRAGGLLRPADEHAAVVRAVADAAPALFVNARTDTYWLRVGPEEERLDETRRRLTAYRDAGASGVFVPGLTGLHDATTLARAVGLPLNVLWRPGLDLTALADAGVTRVSTGSALYRHALAAALATAEDARTGNRPPTTPVDYDRLQRLLQGA